MKRFALILMLSLFTLPVLAQDTFTIYWNSPHYYEAYQEVFDQFAQEHNLKLDVQNFQWPDMRTKLLADFTGGTEPDFIEVPAPWTAEFGAQGLMLDLTENIDNWADSSDWLDNTWNEVTVDDVIYGMKLHHTALGFFYNKDLLEQAGLDPENPPTTLEAFEAAANTITEKTDAFGFGFDGDDQYLLGFLASAETPSLTSGNEIAIDTPTIRTTLTTLQRIAASGNALVPEPGATAQATTRAFIEGQVGMILTGPWDIGNISENAPDLDYGVGKVPIVEGAESRTLAAGTAVGIPSGSRHAELAWELAQRLTAVDTEVAATLEAGMLMPRQSWLDDSRIQNVRTVQEFGSLLSIAVPFDSEVRKLGINEVTWGGDIFSQLYQNIIYNSLPSDQALDEYIETANRTLSRVR